jgi:type I restriction enzyme S subunit
MTWKIVRLQEVLKQYRIECRVQDDEEYSQVTVSTLDGISIRGKKFGRDIGRKRQFTINLKKYPRTLLFVRQTVYYGGIGIAPIDVDNCIVTENMPMFSIENVNPDYLDFVIHSLFFKEAVAKINRTGSAQKAIHERQLLEIEIPLPSDLEQEELVKLLKQSKTSYKRLLLEFLTQGNILLKLREAFFRDAIQGNIVPQDPNDEPASKLFARIKEEKEALIKEGKLKNEKPLPSIRAEEIPFNIPDSWVWCRVGEIIELISGQHIDSQDYNEQGIGFPYITGPADFSEVYPIVKRWTNRPKVFAGLGDILITVKGAGVGKTNICNYEKLVISRQLMAVRPVLIEGDYLHFYLQNMFDQLQSEMKGTGIPGIGRENILYKLFPLPPLEEQKRISAKLINVLDYCNELNNCNQQNKVQADRLLQVILKEALQPKEIAEVIENNY